MNKKKLVALVIALVMLIPMGAYAKAIPTTLKNKPTIKQTTNNADKKVLIEEFKVAIKAKHVVMKDLEKQIKVQRDLVKANSANLRTIIGQIKDGKLTLPAGMTIEKVLKDLKTIKMDSKKVLETPKVKEDVSSVKKNLKNKDFNNAIASLNKVILKLKERLANLTNLNSNLTKLIDSLKTPVVTTP